MSLATQSAAVAGDYGSDRRPAPVTHDGLLAIPGRFDLHPGGAL